MRPGRHAAGDGSFGRSAGAAAFRGAALLAVAVILGIVLLQATDDDDPFDSPVVAGDERPRVTAAPSATTVPTATTRPTRQPSQVKVLVANGTETKGLAGRYSDVLKAGGYNTLAPTDTSRKPLSTSAVYFAAGYEAEARAIASLLKLSAGAVLALPARPPVANVQGANVLAVIGSDLARSAPPTTAPSSTSTSTTTTTAR